jgi:glucokinase
MTDKIWAAGVDLGGTKVEAAYVDENGRLGQRIRRHTDVKDGPKAVEDEIIKAVQDLMASADSRPVGVGVGVAGQIEAGSGVVQFAPNLEWRNIPLQSELSEAIQLPVIVENDVRVATRGEWLHGAGQGCNDLICIFVGTGIGGGIIIDGHMLAGCSNTAGEIGHIVVDVNGPNCHCGNRGCMEALAGGWAIAQSAQEAIRSDPVAGAEIIKQAGNVLEEVSAKIVAQAAQEGDPLAMSVIDQATQALIAGATSLVNAFNPCRLILGGGVIEGMPALIGRIAHGVHEDALTAAGKSLEILPAKLHNDSGVIGAAALAIRQFSKKG